MKASPDQKCLNGALRLLGRRDHSRAELSRKLSLRGFGAAQIASALAECERLGYLDDGKFCRLCILQQRRKGYGILRITQTLKEKGISAVQIHESIRADCSEVNQIEDCRCVLAKKKGSGSPARGGEPMERLYRFLLSRGFTAAVIHRVLEEEKKGSLADRR